LRKLAGWLTTSFARRSGSGLVTCKSVPSGQDAVMASYAVNPFVYGDFRRVHRMGIIACQYRAAEWRHKEIELAAHELLQRLDNRHS
jgi:hypothetical protein